MHMEIGHKRFQLIFEEGQQVFWVGEKVIYLFNIMFYIEITFSKLLIF